MKLRMISYWLDPIPQFGFKEFLELLMFLGVLLDWDVTHKDGTISQVEMNLPFWLRVHLLIKLISKWVLSWHARNAGNLH